MIIKNKNLHIKVSEEMYDNLLEVAEKKDMTYSEIIRECIRKEIVKSKSQNI